jgi:hypothetical protein
LGPSRAVMVVLPTDPARSRTLRWTSSSAARSPLGLGSPRPRSPKYG